MALDTLPPFLDGLAKLHVGSKDLLNPFFFFHPLCKSQVKVRKYFSEEIISLEPFILISLEKYSGFSGEGHDEKIHNYPFCFPSFVLSFGKLTAPRGKGE
jgi:hypothetical protein